MRLFLSILTFLALLAGGVRASEGRPVAPSPTPGGPGDAAILEGLSALHQGRFSEGQARFRAFLEADPTDPRGHLFLAFAEWWKLLQFGIDSGSPLVDQYLQEAIHRAQVRLSEHPGDPESLASLGTAYIFLAQHRTAQGKAFRAAVAAKRGKGFLEKALDSDPYLVDPRFGLGGYNYYADKVNVLVKGLRTMLFLPGGDSALGLAQLKEVAERGRYFRTEAHLLLAVISQSRHEHRYLSALEHLHAALALNPGSPVILATIGELQIRLGRYPEAQATLKRCVEISGRSGDRDQMELARMTRILLADSLDLALHSRDALRELDTAPTGDELSPEMRRRALAVSTRAALRLGDTQRLERLYQLLAATPEERTALRERYGADPREADMARLLEPALRLLEGGEPEEAMRTLRELNSRYPHAPEIRFHLARACFEQERYSEAEAAFRQIRTAPREEIPAWIQGWSDLYLGRSLQVQGKTSLGSEFYLRASQTEGFRARDLARALLGPEGSEPGLWPRQIFGSGPQNSQDAGDVGPGFPEGRNAAVALHRVFPGVVGR